MTLEEEIRRWKKYRDALRSGERQTLDELFDACRLHASASSMSNRPVPLDSMLISILLEQQKAIRRLREGLEQIKRQIRDPQ